MRTLAYTRALTSFGYQAVIHLCSVHWTVTTFWALTHRWPAMLQRHQPSHHTTATVLLRDPSTDWGSGKLVAGANNVMNRTSRRVFWGTAVGWIGPWDRRVSIPSRQPEQMDWLHVGSVAALPRDLRLGSAGLEIMFVPELIGLREDSSHVHVLK